MLGKPRIASLALVTFLNDLSFCPLGYFSVAVRWRAIDERCAKLSLTHTGNTVRAVLTFGADGRPLDWDSEDRYADVKGKPLPDCWSTSMQEYGEVAGLRVPVRGQGLHNYDGSPSPAGRMSLPTQSGSALMVRSRSVIE